MILYRKYAGILAYAKPCMMHVKDFSFKKKNRLLLLDAGASLTKED